MTEFTKERLERTVKVGRSFGDEIAVPGNEAADLAAFALALMERAENAEAERDDAIERWARRAKEAEARLESVEAERDRLRGDLADALDLQAGHGPTALASVVMERDRIRKELEEAEEAIRWMHGYDEPGTPSFPVELGVGNRYGWRKVSNDFPAVRRACERGGR